MSEYTPTTDEVLRCYQIPMTAEQGQRDGESFAEFLSRRSIETFQQQIADREAAARWLAEVERAAAEKALRGAALSGRFGTNAQSVLLELADSARAWNQGYLAASRDFMQNAPFENAAANPYRRNEGENDGRE